VNRGSQLSAAGVEGVVSEALTPQQLPWRSVVQVNVVKGVGDDLGGSLEI
jgi:hypothetical protein